MLIISPELAMAVNSPEVMTAKLFDLAYQLVKGGPDLHLRFTDWGDDISFDGSVYKTFTIKVGDISQSSSGKISNVTLSIGNLDEDREIQQILENNVIIGNKVAIMECFFDITTKQMVGAPLSLTLRVMGAKARKGQVDFDMSVGFDFFMQSVPNRKAYAQFCRWKVFKGCECKYVGTASDVCDKTYDDCLKKGNTANFGGFPAIPNTRLYF